MKLLYSIFFGAGVAGFAYSRLGRRVGYGNQQSVWLIVGVVFVLVTAVFFSIFSLFITEE